MKICYYKKNRRYVPAGVFLPDLQPGLYFVEKSNNVTEIINVAYYGIKDATGVIDVAKTVDKIKLKKVISKVLNETLNSNNYTIDTIASKIAEEIILNEDKTKNE
jgi:hypothetical protein